MNYRASVYTGRPADPEAVYLGSEAFPVYGDGIRDDTENIQRAVNHVKETLNFGIVFLPEGKYLVSDTIYMPTAVRLIGYGKKRPEILLKDHAPGFDVPHPESKSGGKEVFWFVARPVHKPEDIWDANPGTFYSAISNVNITIGEGNPYAVALRTHYAQHSFINHCEIRIGSALAGMYDAGNEMENVHFIGGEYGIITTKCSPGWPFMAVDCSFTGQRKAGMYSQELGFTAVRVDFSDMPKAIDTFAGYHDKIYLEDCRLENISDYALNLHLENNEFTQWNLAGCYCKNVPHLLKKCDLGETIEGPAEQYVIDRLTHGIVLEDMSDPGEIRTECLTHPVDHYEKPFCDVPVLPDFAEWMNVRELGAKGDNTTDDTEVLQKAIDTYKVLYLPQGWYKVSDTLKLRDDTVLIGLSPISTQIKLPNNTEKFGDLGPAKALIESGRGANIINGIGIDTGARNPRAVGLKWTASEESFINDVKFIGGHGTMTHEYGKWSMPYNDSRTADPDPANKWDTQYWSFWVTENGGGVIKDVWSASSYCAAGFYASDTSARGRIYCMSVEHHVRNEVKFHRVSNWKVYALQTEEEVAEGQQCLPLEVTCCKDMTFATYYAFRVIWLPNPYPTAIRSSDNDNIEWLNFHNFTQVKYTLTNGMIDTNAHKEIRPWQIARYVMKPYETAMPELNTEVPVCLFGGFEFADGAAVDPEGNLWFVDGRYNRIYRLNAETGRLSLIRDVPQRPLSLFFDTEGNLVVVTEFMYPRGATRNGEVMKFTKPADSRGTAYGIWYYPFNQVKLYTIDPEDPEHTMTVLEKRPWTELGPVAKAMHPANRWRENNSYLSATLITPENGYLCPDGKTVVQTVGGIVAFRKKSGRIDQAEQIHSIGGAITDGKIHSG